MERFYCSKKTWLLPIFFFLIFDVGILRANNNLSQKQATPKFHTIGLSEKDVDVILAHPDIDFAYMPEEVVDAFLLIETVIPENQRTESTEELYYYLHNDYNVAPEDSIQEVLESCPPILESNKIQRKELLNRITEEFNLYNENLLNRKASISIGEEETSYGRKTKIHCELTSSPHSCHQKHCKPKCPTGPTGPQGIQGPTGPTGPTGAFTGVFLDNAFSIVDATDATKQLNFDVQGSPSTLTTIITNPSVNRSLTTPDIDGTLIVAQTGTNEVFIGGPTGPLHSSGAGIQYSTIVASRAQIRENQYGNNTGVPGISTFKSRGATFGSLAPVMVGDIIYQASAFAVPGNSLYPANSSGLISIIASAVPSLAGWIATDYELQLVPLAGIAPRQTFRITSEGIFHITESTDGMAGVATTSAGGSIAVSNANVTATSRITLTIQFGGPTPTGFVYVSARSAGTFTITSSSGQSGIVVYYQIWEPTT